MAPTAPSTPLPRPCSHPRALGLGSLRRTHSWPPLQCEHRGPGRPQRPPGVGQSEQALLAQDPGPGEEGGRTVATCGQATWILGGILRGVWDPGTRLALTTGSS